MNMPAEKLQTLNKIVELLKNVSNVVSVVLGGSHARGLARPDSDLDIGIYYRETAPFAVEEIRSLAEKICSPGSAPTVTGLYEWGPWVNGGAWIQTPGCEVDFFNQFAAGFSAESTMNISIGIFRGSSLSPSCSWSGPFTAWPVSTISLPS